MNIEAPEAQLIYSRTIEVLGSIKEIQLFWGDLASVVNNKSSVLISSNVHNENRLFLNNGIKPEPIGMVWSSLKKKFDLDQFNFQPVLEATAGSSIWSTSDTMENTLKVYGKEFRRLIRIDCLKPCSKKENIPQNIFCLHTLPFHQKRRNPEANSEDYKYTLDVCLAAIRAQEATDFMTRKNLEPYTELVMSALAAQQFDHPHQLLRYLLDIVAQWFLVSPKLKLIKVCYWDRDIHQKLFRRLKAENNNENPETINITGKIRQDLLHEIGEKAIHKTELERESTRLLVEEFKIQLEDFKQLDLIQNESELNTDILNMLVVLNRDNPTTLEIGSGAGRLAEGLVNHLCLLFYGKRPNTFHGGIEDLAIKPPTSNTIKGIKISAWYKSYLHTLRILRNTSAHSQDEPDNLFPPKLTNDDTWILIVSLKRVIGLHAELLKII
jgi:hypothetical protein